jgi:MarR family transcriptional regulator, lower aerobic nicotinate degradation pathway regulator
MPELPVVQPPYRSAALLDYLSRRMRLRSEAALAPLGLRPRHLVALTMLRDTDSIAQQGLAEMLELDGTNVVGLLNELEAEQLVTRRRSPEDRRRHIVELTQAGREKLAQAEFVLAAVEDYVLADLSLEQRGALFELLRQATAQLVHPAVECDAARTDTVGV